MKAKENAVTARERKHAHALHDCTAMLLQLSQKPRKLLLDKLRNVVVLVVLLLLVMLLLLSTVVLSLLVSLVGRISGTMAPSMTTLSRSQRLSALQVDVHATSILLGAVLQPQLLTKLLDLGLDLLDMAG